MVAFFLPGHSADENVEAAYERLWRHQDVRRSSPPERRVRSIKYVTDGKEVVAIVVNHWHPGERQRLTLACELAHALLSFVGKPSASMRESAIESFAGALLVPEQGLREAAGTHGIAHRLRVSARFET